MTLSPNVCPEGWEAAQLLAYIEGHLEPEVEKDLVQHLQECRVCSLELESLRRLDSLLRVHPETFHPDDEELYRFASEQADPGGHIALHVETCSECEANLGVLREMIGLRAAEPGHSKMPQALEREVERIHGGDIRPGKRSLISVFSDLLRKTFSVPILALGTAAAVLILSVFVIPMWRALKEIPTPAAVPPAEKAAETQGEWPAQSPDLEGRISTEERRDDRQPRQVYPKAESARMRPQTGPVPVAPAPGQIAPESKPELGVARPGAAPLGFLEKRGKESQALREEPKTDKPVRTIPMPARESKLKEKEEQPESVETARRSVMPPAKATPDTRTPVRVLITDAEGEPVPWLHFVPDAAMENRYAFVGLAALKDELSKKKAAPGSPAPPVEARQGYMIAVRVTESGGTYEIEAKLFPEGVATDAAALRTVVARNLKKEDVSARMTSLVGLLLGH